MFKRKEYQSFIDQEKKKAVQRQDLVHELRKDFVAEANHTLTNHFSLELPDEETKPLQLYVFIGIDGYLDEKK
jgi:hypothetical protein